MVKEMKAPPRRVPDGDDGYFEILTKSVFQSGFRWSVVEQKWPAFRRAFDDFDIDKVAAYGPPDVDRLLADPGIVRNGRKIESTVANAAAMRELARTYGSVRKWLATTAELPWPERKKAVSAPFKHIGATGAYVFLWSIGESVPPHDAEATWSGPVPPGSPERLA